MRERILIIGFILLGVGTIGLLINEFFFDWGRGATLTFAIINVVGFISLASARFCMKK
jgi:hypothetical protein